MPALRLVGVDERLPPSIEEDQPATGWASDPAALLALAIALGAVVGESPDPYAEGMTPELQAWFDRHGRAAEILVEIGDGDAAALRAAAPKHPDIGDAPPGHSLLILAAIIIERGRT